MLIINARHYSFGSPMPGRTFSSNSYRYGFNGMEKDNETTVDGGSYDFGNRIYDARLGRWNSTDRFMGKYPSMSPYHYAANNPIIFIDQDGNDFIIFTKNTTRTDTHFEGEDYMAVNSSVKETYSIQIIKAEGPDQFLYQETTDHVTGKSVEGKFQETSREATKTGKRLLLHPETYIAQGATQSPNDVLDGILSWAWDDPDPDYVSVGKFMMMSSSFKDYMLARNSKANGWLIMARGYSAEQMVLTTVVTLAAAELTSLVAVSNIAKIDAIAAQDLKYYNSLKSPTLDCSEIAETMNATHQGGQMLKITPKTGKYMKGMEYGQQEEWMYHQVYEKDGYIYDAMHGADPVKKADYMKSLNDMNPGGLNVETVAH